MWSVTLAVASGLCRGFAFVTMERVDDLEKVLAQGSHILDTKPVDCKRALAHAVYQVCPLLG